MNIDATAVITCGEEKASFRDKSERSGWIVFSVEGKLGRL